LIRRVAWFFVVGLVAPLAVSRAAEPQMVQAEGVSLALPLGLQADAAYVSEDNPPTDARVELGRLLYFDKRLSDDASR
jgi:cytochrome c peroxidase